MDQVLDEALIRRGGLEQRCGTFPALGRPRTELPR